MFIPSEDDDRCKSKIVTEGARQSGGLGSGWELGICEGGKRPGDRLVGKEVRE